MKTHPLTISEYMHLINPRPKMMSHYATAGYSHSTATAAIPPSSLRSVASQKEVPMDCLETCIGHIVRLGRCIPAVQKLLALDLLNAIVLHVNKQ